MAGSRRKAGSGGKTGSGGTAGRGGGRKKPATVQAVAQTKVVPLFTAPKPLPDTVIEMPAVPVEQVAEEEIAPAPEASDSVHLARKAARLAEKHRHRERLATDPEAARAAKAAKKARSLARLAADPALAAARREKVLAHRDADPLREERVSQRREKARAWREARKEKV